MKVENNKEIEKWYNALQKRDFKISKEIANNNVIFNKKTLQNASENIEEVNNCAYYYGVLYKGLYEFCLIGEITSKPNWNDKNENFEEVWRLMCNCYDRFSFCRKLKHFFIFDYLYERLNELNNQFINYFGNGLYASPDIFIKKEECSICLLNIKACSHIPGNLYNGKLCYSIPKDFKMPSVSLVQFPRDPRCRVWHWNFTDKYTFKTPIMTFFKIDDWLDEKLT